MSILIEKIKEQAERAQDPEIYEDLFSAIREENDHMENKWLRRRSAELLKTGDPEKFFDLYKRTLLFDAPLELDSYLLYLEINRNPEDRFYQPRRRILKQVVDALQDLSEDKLDELFLSLPPRVGKALANDTPVMTRNGWKNHGDLVVGDEVVGMDGEYKKVLAVHPKCMLDRLVEFTNGEKIQCHEKHEWLLHDRSSHKTSLMETKRCEKRALDNDCVGRGHRYALQLPHTQPMAGEKKELPLDPYTFGVWLGDGINRTPTICNPRCDKTMIDKIEANGNSVSWHTVHKITGVDYYGFKFRKVLSSMGMCNSKHKTDKYIPEIYLTASLEQRLELLAGLIDSDGTKNEKQIDFSTCGERLRDTFCELISTFGWNYCVQRHEPRVSSSGIIGRQVVWHIKFTPQLDIPCVLERKRIRDFGIKRKMAMKSITKVEPKEGNCITVEGGVYLAGKRMIPTHNSSLMLFFMTWVMGRDSEHPNLYSSYTDIITAAFYNGVLEILTDKDTYLWGDVFPGIKISRTNAKDEIIDIQRRKHYPTLTCRSIDGTINGACDAQDGYIIADDLVSGIEEAMSKDRLLSKWSKVDNNLIPRGKGKTKYLWIGTRWSVIDPSGIRLDTIQNDKKYEGYRYKVINIPALNENDESNFNYPYGVGFDTLYYQRRRASFERNNDMASWSAQYMGTPIEREGTLFNPDDFRYFNGELPENPDRIFMPVDPAFGGGDYVSAPVCVKSGDEIYVIDVVYNNGDKKITQPLLVNMVKKYNVSAMRIEATKATESYKEGVEEKLKSEGIHINITTKAAPTQVSKSDRIFDKAPEIRDRMVFLESGKRSKEYEMFMQNLFGYKLFAKKQHDDAPDSLAMAIDMDKNPYGKYEIFTRFL